MSSTNEGAEHASAQREALEAAAKRTGSTAAVEEALQRYLASEQFHERRRQQEEAKGESAADDQPEP
jgi:hypothetical protein